MSIQENKMTTASLMNKLIADYSEEDSKFSSKAMALINKHFADMPPGSDLDPKRLGSKSVFISGLKTTLLNKMGPIDVDGNKPEMEEFNKLGIKEQLRFQALKSKQFPWVENLQIVPENLLGLHPSDKEKNELQRIRNGRNKEKLREDVQTIDGDRLFKKLLPYLSNPRAKWYQIAASLLLATGRRTIEILKLGSFRLGKDHDPQGYKCIFDGQAKQKIETTGPYEIHLLAPFSLVDAALQKLRALKPTDDLSSDKVNANYGRSINSWLQRSLGMNPHMLRAAYALLTYELQKGPKSSIIGHIAKVLGHLGDANAIFYQRLKIENVPKLWQAPDDEVEELVQAVDELSLEGWEADGAVEKKRLKDIRDRMMHKLPISVRAMKTTYGGTPTIWNRLLEKNKEKVDEYNTMVLEAN